LHLPPLSGGTSTSPKSTKVEEWLDEHNECESGGISEAFENYCHDFNGEYGSCASGCRQEAILARQFISN